jgi:PPE-repeat protein
MGFGALPPEVNSGRMYVGPGPATLLAASAGWEWLAIELHSAASGYQSVISGLTDESWMGPAAVSMAAAVSPYLSWIRATAGRCEETATRATAAAAAYETAFAMTVPPPMVVANRGQLATLIATNFLGQNTPAIAATEAEYSEMWAKDAAAMYNYAASSATASSFSTFTPPPQTTNPSGLGGRAGTAGAQAGTGTGTSANPASMRLISSVPQALQGLSTPGSSSGLGISGMGMTHSAEVASGLGSDAGDSGGFDFGAPADPWAGADGGAAAGLGQADSIGYLSVPPGWADMLSVDTSVPVLDANVMPGGWGAMPSAGTSHVSKLPLGGMVGREAEGVVQRVGFRSSLVMRSSVAG